MIQVCAGEVRQSRIPSSRFNYKAERLLGFRAEIPLEEGLRNLWTGGDRNEFDRAKPQPKAVHHDSNRKAGARGAEAEAARHVVLSGWVTLGPQVAAFEREFAAYVGAPHACAVSSCTTALHWPCWRWVSDQEMRWLQQVTPSLQRRTASDIVAQRRFLSISTQPLSMSSRAVA